MSKTSEVRQFMRELEEKGWKLVRKARNNHYIMSGPQGMAVVFPSSPSDNRWIKNKRCEIKRIERGIR